MTPSFQNLEDLARSTGLDEEEAKELSRMRDELTEFQELKRRKAVDPTSLSYAEEQRYHLLWVNINGSVGKPDNLRNRVRSKLLESLLSSDPSTPPV